MKTEESAGIPKPDGFFDLIYAISVFTHITDEWAAWLLEHHRLLKKDGILIATFLGEGMIEELIGEPWDDEHIGMNALFGGIPWEVGGPSVFHSQWWLEAHWGRAFDIVELRPHLGIDRPAGHGLIVLRRKEVSLTAPDLERLQDDEPREVSALQHQVRQLQREILELRTAVRVHEDALSHAAIEQEASHRLATELEDAHRQLREVKASRSWRITRPIRAVKTVLGPQVGPAPSQYQGASESAT